MIRIKMHANSERKLNMGEYVALYQLLERFGLKDIDLQQYTLKEKKDSTPTPEPGDILDAQSR